MDKNKIGNLWLNIGFPSNIANILKFLMLELRNHEPLLFGQCVKNLFLEESFDNIVIDILLQKVPKRKDERTICYEQVQQKLNCFYEHAIIDMIDEQDTCSFIVINDINVIKFNLHINIVETIFDVNNLAINQFGSILLINDNQSYTFKTEIKDKVHWSSQYVSVIEAIQNCKNKKVGLCWSSKKLKNGSIVNALNEWTNMIKNNWTIKPETMKHLTWSVNSEAIIDCSICQDDEIKKPIVQLSCGHCLHIDCFNKFISSDGVSKKCPLDRQDISPFVWSIEVIGKVHKKVSVPTNVNVSNIPDESDMSDLD
jgi:hypothetical protein